VVRAALYLIEQRRYDEVATLVDSVALQVYRTRRLEEARLDAQHAREVGHGDLVNDPDFSLAIADYFAQSDYHEKKRESGELRHGGGTSVEQLEKMTAAQLLGAALRSLDPRTSDDAGAAPGPGTQPRRVIGEVISGDAAYVLYTSRWSVPHGVANLAVLNRSRAGWALLPHGELFGQNAVSAPEGSAESTPKGLAALPVRQANWIGRSFNHLLSVDLFPAVLERLRGTPARLTELTASTPLSWRTAKPDGKWSIQEHVGHLLDLEALGELRLQDFLAHAASLTPADITNRKTDEARHNDARLADLLHRFRTARERLVAQLAGLTFDILIHSARHPRLERYMNVVDWMFFMCEHDDHHLARIRERLADLAALHPR
jgi:hypothetical protein